MKQNKIKICFCLIISILLFSSFLSSVNAIDEYGNQLTDIYIYQKVGDSHILCDSFSNNTYIENTNFTLQNDYSPFYFYYKGLLNTSLSSFSNITYTMGYGIQVYQTNYFAGGSTLVLSIQENGFWWVNGYSETIVNSIDETALCNVTVWVDYHNGTGYLLIEEYVFNLISETYVPPVIPDILNLNVVWFWFFVITLFSTPIFSVVAFKSSSGTYAIYALLSFGFCITFLAMIIN